MEYKVLCADDELIEREALSTLVDWASINASLTGCAKNGLEALSLLEKERPDIVVTDIKMPKMDGLELISECRKRYPEPVFVILSGYGEFEFTSKAMELGIRHYILKPVDSEKVLSSVSKAIEDVKKNRESKGRLNLLLPAAKSLFFQHLLTGVPVTDEEKKMYLSTLTFPKTLFSLMVKGFLEEKESIELLDFVEKSIASCTILFSSCFGNELEFLLSEGDFSYLQQAARKIRAHLLTLSKDVSFALSPVSSIEEIANVRNRNIEIMALQKEEKRGTISTSLTDIVGKELLDKILDRTHLFSISSFIELYRYTLILSSRLSLLEDRERRVVLQTLFSNLGVDEPSIKDRKELFEALIKNIKIKENLDERINTLYKGLFLNLDNSELSVKWASSNIMFMSEDYFSRFFLKSTGVRFTEFVNRERINLSKALLEVKSDLNIQQLALHCGYPEDGQYFSRLFKSITGETVAKWRDKER